MLCVLIFFIMIDHVYLLYWCWCILVAMCASRRIPNTKDGEEHCREVPELSLEEILGPAFNPRYMSIEEPSIDDPGISKRRIGYDLAFYVENGNEHNSEDKPAWSVINHVEEVRNVFGNTRYRRNLDYLQEWHCKSRIKWTDLGPDYFPRYLRSVECVAENCWFNIYKCRPRSFSVKILKRRRDRCVPLDRGGRVGVSGLPRELKELWVWEERAVAFCCDCAAK